MGVKDLWGILSPSCEKKSLWELEGMTVAIDLSSWIVDSQNIGDNTQINMYLRNLFFRASYLLLLGVKPVFILEGKAPEIKHGTIARRLQIHKDGNIPSKNKNGSRGRLNCLQKRCEELLKSLGVRCYKSDGEAEALCSRLNELGEVYAVISQDSDCFLYGARIVLRNFTMSPSYTCDMYTMENIEAKLGLGREKLLALSLLCGCDYEAGVQGVGKQSALKFLSTLPDDQVLDRLRSWKKYTCDDGVKLSQLNQEEKLEYNIKKKALLDSNFPSEDVISEFLTCKVIDLPNFIWSKPSLANFMVIAQQRLLWEEDYIYSKLLPILARWQLLHGERDGGARSGLHVECVNRQRTLRGVACYELQWIHDDVGPFTSVEPVSLVTHAYPELHFAFLKSKEKPKKATKGRKKKNQPVNKIQDVENLLQTLNISGQVKQPIKKRSKQNPETQLQTLDKYIFRDKTNKATVDCINAPSVISHSTPIRTAEHTMSYHYISDDSELDYPKNKSLDKSSSLQNVNTGDLHEYSLQNSFKLQSVENLTTDSTAFDLSDIVNSIVNRNSVNPAIKIWENHLDSNIKN